MFHRALTSTLLFFTLPALLSAAGIPITGEVFGPDGEPRAKAAVRLEAIPPTYERAVLRLEGKPGPEPVERTRTGADGTFELEAPEAGMWKVVVSAPRMLTLELRLIPLVDAAVLPAVTLVPAADLEVRLVDAEGKARRGAVGAVPTNVRGNGWRPQLRLARAGEDGVARLPLGKDEKIQLEVLAEEHPLAIFDLFDETSVTIDLEPGVAGTVRITDQLRRPLAGALAFQGSALLPLGLSDEQGLLPLVLQATRRPAVKVSAANRWNGSFEVDFGKAEDTSPQGGANGTTKDLRLEPPQTIHGRVLDLSTRDPVAGALVWAVRGEVAVTDEHGSYAFDDGIYKSRFVQAAAAGYQPGKSQLDKDGETAIGLTPAAALAGKVLDRDGALLAGVSIELSLLPGSGAYTAAAQRAMRGGWRGRTSDRGAFRVTGVPAGVGYRLTFKRLGFAPGTLDVEPLEPFENRSGLKVVLEPGRLAFGRVVDEDDVPVAGAEIRLDVPPPTGDPMTAMRMTRWRRDQADTPTYLTDADGRFEIADLAAGSYDLNARAAGFAPARVPGLRVAEGDREADFGTVVLIPGAPIAGRVTDAGGAAVAGVEVTVDRGRRGFMAMPAPGPPDQTTTDERGRFVVADLLPGQPVTVTAFKKGYASESVAAVSPPTEEPLAIVLQAAGRLTGKVVDPRDDPIEGASVMAHPDPRAMTPGRMARQRGGGSGWARTGADGTFVIEDLDPATLQVTADAEGYLQRIHTGVELAAGAEIELELVLERGAVVEGTVTTADGEPVVQASINVSELIDDFSHGDVISAHGRTDVEGHYQVTGAPTGMASISVHHESGHLLEKAVEVRPGTNIVDLVLERGFEIRGQVITPDATPIGGAAVSLQPARQVGMMHFSFTGTKPALSAGDGTFTLTGVKAGKYMVTASRDGYAPASAETVEVAGDVGGVLLELRHGATLKGRIVGLTFDELGSLSLAAYSAQGGMRQGRVDFEAEYAFENVAPGQWHVRAQVGSSGRSTALQIEVPEGVPEVIRDIEFGTGFTLSGVVLDGGQPLAGVNVNASGTSGSSGAGMTGDDGRFRIESLKPGSYRVMVMAGMGGLQHMEMLELAGDHELRIELATGTVSGTVRDDAGEPLSGVAVALEQIGAENPLLAPRFAFGNRAESDSRGYFQLPRVRQGNWRVVATKAGYAPGEATVAVAGGGAPEVEIRLTPTEGISFAVVLDSGVTVQAVQVSILDPSGRPLASGRHAVIDGRVRVSTVPPGRWELVVQGGDSASTRFAVNAPGDQGRLVLPTGGILHLRVPELKEVQAASVKLTGPDGKPFVSTMGVAFGPGQWLLNAGETMVTNLVPGVWSFTVTHDGRTWSGSAAVTPGATTEVSLP